MNGVYCGLFQLCVWVCLTASAAAQGVNSSLAAPPGQHGVWVPPNAGDERLVESDALNVPPANPFAIETNPLQRTPRAEAPPPPAAARSFRKLTLSEVPFQPWARAVYTYRQGNLFEPHTRCKPSGGPRPFMTPYGVEFLEQPELQRVFIIDIGGPHTMRTVFLDRQTHPGDIALSYLGDSVGHWEGSSLVVDSVGFNERFWLDRFGLPHTQQLHLIERFTRLDESTLRYDLTVDDPGAYTATWTSGLLLRWNPNQELFEYVCQDNNLAPSLMLGTVEPVENQSPTVP